MPRLANYTDRNSRGIPGRSRELKSAPSSLSPSPTPRRFKHSHLASRVSQGERRVSVSRLARTFTLVRWSQMGSLYAIFGPSPFAQRRRASTTSPVKACASKPKALLYLSSKPSTLSHSSSSRAFHHLSSSWVLHYRDSHVT